MMSEWLNSAFKKSSARGLIWGALSMSTAFLTACMPPPPPQDISNVCHMFHQYPSWYRATKSVEKRWGVPIPVQMAILHQESKFDGSARPPRIWLLGIIPWKHPTTAYGYSQALDGTWDLYRRTEGSFFSSRTDFYDAVDFIGWYANLAHRQAHISRHNAYKLYLAYHEGIGGYQRGTYWHKHWLIPVAHKVSYRAALYKKQLSYCRSYR